MVRAAATAKEDKKALIKEAGSSSVTLICQLLGSSLLSLPYITQQIGWVFQVIIQIIILTLNYICFYYITEVIHYTQSKSYPEAVAKVLNNNIRVLLEVCIAVLYYGYCTSYIVISSTHMISFFENVANWSPNSYAVKAIISVVIIYPLCLIKNLAILGKISYISIVAIIITAVTIFVYFFVYLDRRQLCGATQPYGIRMLPDATPAMRLLYFIMYIPSMWSNYSCHMIVPTMMDELQGPAVIRKKIVFLSICIAFALAAVLYWAVGFMGAAMFGTGVTDNIVLSFKPCQFIWLGIVSLLYCIVVVIAYPLLMYPAKIMLAQMCKVDPHTRRGYWVMAGITATYVLCSMVLAMFFERIVTIFGLFSAISGIIFYFLVPGVFMLRYPRIKAANIDRDRIEDDQATVDPLIVGVLSMIAPVMTRGSISRARAFSNRVFPAKEQAVTDKVISPFRQRTFSFKINQEQTQYKVRAMSMVVKGDTSAVNDADTNDPAAPERFKEQPQTVQERSSDGEVSGGQNPGLLNDGGQDSSNSTEKAAEPQTRELQVASPNAEESSDGNVVQTIQIGRTASGAVTAWRRILSIAFIVITVLCCLVGICMNLYDMVNLFRGGDR